MSGFIRRQPMFESSVGRSPRLYDIVPERLTLRRNPPFRYHETGYGVDPYVLHHETMFHEIDMVPVVETWGPEVRALAEEPIEKVQVGAGEFYDIVFRTFMDVVEEAWQPEKFHVVLHSGGYDSRLISLAVRRLYEKNGDDWLGDLIFLEVEGEHVESRQAVLAEGWDEGKFVVYGRGGAEHHVRSCDFATAYRRTNCGMYGRLFNYWYDPVEWDDVQGWSGVMANDVAHGLRMRGLDWVLRVLPYHVYTLAPDKGDWVYPYLSVDLIRVLVKYGEGQAADYSRAVLSHVAPEVGGIRNPGSGCGRVLSDRLFRQVTEDYRNSWYGREVAPDAVPYRRVEYEPWWCHWGLASFCEELRRDRSVRVHH